MSYFSFLFFNWLWAGIFGGKFKKFVFVLILNKVPLQLRETNIKELRKEPETRATRGNSGVETVSISGTLYNDDEFNILQDTFSTFYLITI